MVRLNARKKTYTASQSGRGELTGYRYDQQNLKHETDGNATATDFTTTDEEYGDLLSQYDFVDQGLGTGEFYQQFDAQYAANAVVDDSGSVVQRFRFKAFGLPAPNTAASGWETLSADEWSGMSVGGWSVLPVNAAAGIRLNWGGKKQYQFDGETGLFILGAGSTDGGGRYYDPVTGKFISDDPIRYAAGDVNLNGYVGNNPVQNVDPDGKQATTPPLPPPLKVIASDEELRKILQPPDHLRRREIQKLASSRGYFVDWEKVLGARVQDAMSSTYHAAQTYGVGSPEHGNAYAHWMRQNDMHWLFELEKSIGHSGNLQGVYDAIGSDSIDIVLKAIGTYQMEERRRLAAAAAELERAQQIASAREARDFQYRASIFGIGFALLGTDAVQEVLPPQHVIDQWSTAAMLSTPQAGVPAGVVVRSVGTGLRSIRGVSIVPAMAAEELSAIRAARSTLNAVPGERNALRAVLEGNLVMSAPRNAVGAYASGEARVAATEAKYSVSSFGGRRVYKNALDIDPGVPGVVDRTTLHPKVLERLDAGATNLDLMREGIAPIGRDGLQINLHHILVKRPAQ